MNVLVADDSAVPRLILERNLIALGHGIASALDGEEAWRSITRSGPMLC